MDILEKTLELLSKYPLCDYCLGRQFASLGYSMENNIRGSALKITLVLAANDFVKQGGPNGIEQLKILATNGFSEEAKDTLKHLNKRIPKQAGDSICYLCEDAFEVIDALTEKSLNTLAGYEFTTYLVGIEVPRK